VSSTAAGVTLESSASVGLTRFDPARFPSQREFIQAADARLYAAKRARVGDRRRAA
jgi:GGDEF domain-containing protein